MKLRMHKICEDGYFQGFILMVDFKSKTTKFTFGKDQSSIVRPLSDVFESLGTVIQCIHSSHVGQQSLEVRGKMTEYEKESIRQQEKKNI